MVTRIGSLGERVLAWMSRVFAHRPLDPPGSLAAEGAGLPGSQCAAVPFEHTRLRLLADNLPHAMIYQVVVAEPGGRKRFTYLSRSVEKLHGVSPEEVAGDPAVLYGQVLPDYLPGLLAAEQKALEEGTCFRYEAPFRLPSGEVRWFELNSIPNRLADGSMAWDGISVETTARKQAEDRLRESEQRLCSLIEAANLGTWRYLPETGKVCLDERAQSILGLSDTGESDPLRLLAIVHPEDRAEVEQAVNSGLNAAQGGVFEFDCRIVSPNGSLRWVSGKGQSLAESTAEKDIARFSGTLIDTTGRRRAEEALRESEEHFRTLADNMAQFAWMADENGDIFWYNKRWYDYTGTTLEEMRGWGWQAVHHPEHVQQVVEKIRHCFQAGIEWEDTFPLRGRDGEYRWFLSKAVPIRDQYGKVVRWFGTNTDITEQREAEDRLRESRSLYRSRLAELQTIYKSAPIGLCVLDGEFRYIRVNDQMAGFNGISAAEHIGRTVRELVPDLASQLERVVSQVIWTGQPVIDSEISGETPALPGIVRYWMVNCHPLHNDAGQIVNVNVTSQEITDRKRAEQQRQELLEAEQAARLELERYGRLKDEFLATVSHELRSPLNAILGWTRLLSQGKAELERSLEIIERNAQGLARIVEDLLDTSRIISGKIHLQPTTVDMGNLVQNVLDAMLVSAQAKGIELNAWIDPQLKPISCDPNRIQQVIWNLLSNAVKFTPAGGKVWLSIARADSSVQIVVKDTGQGIAQEFLSQLFGRFQQADSSIARRHGGLGLGLAITKYLVELHGGTISAQSEGENCGSVFIVRLPDVRESLAEPTPGPALGRLAAATIQGSTVNDELLAGLTMLVVDDDPDSCELAARILRSAGANVETANSAEEGFEIMMDLRPDALISDISMPHQDGYAFIRKVRACGGWCADLAAIAVTALARPEDRTRVLEAGYDDYLAKPFTATALPAVVSTLTARQESKPQGAGVVMSGEPGQQSSEQGQPRTGSDGKRILLAEDNAAICDMLRIYLEGGGYRVTAVPTVQQALAAAQREPFDLLLSDFRLADGTGWELMEQLRQIRPLPGVMLSGYSDPFYLQKSRKAGFGQYLVKPVEEEQLLSAVREALEKPDLS